MSRYNPDEGTSYIETMGWSTYSSAYKISDKEWSFPLLKLGNSYPCRINEVSNMSPYVNFPFEYGQISICSNSNIDNKSGYDDIYEVHYPGPSPYLSDGSKNPLYSSTKRTYHSEMSGNCLSNFNGKENCENILKIATGQIDWKTASIIEECYFYDKDEGEGYDYDDRYPAVCCCWRYHTSGTNQGDWYLPSIAELGYLPPRNYTISKTFQLIFKNYIQGIYTVIGEPLWTSSSRGDGYVKHINGNYHCGLIGSQYINDLGAIAFIRL